MFTKMAETRRGSARRRRKEAVIVAAVALPPVSRKFAAAGEPRRAVSMSVVFIARPAPLTRVAMRGWGLGEGCSG